MVSAPAYLFDHVAKMIRELDQAAVQDYTVRMVHVHRGMSADRMKDILNEVYMQKSSEKASEKPPSERAARRKTCQDPLPQPRWNIVGRQERKPLRTLKSLATSGLQVQCRTITI